MLIQRGSPGFSGVKPVGASLHRADMGGQPEHPGAAGDRRRPPVRPHRQGVRGHRGEDPHLPPVPGPHPQPLFGGHHHQLHRGGEDELADSASSELASIRRHMRSTEAKVREILQKIISSNQSKYLQESIITIRSDRYVVPVKSEFKNSIPGLVHDVSSSGSTFFIEPMGGGEGQQRTAGSWLPGRRRRSSASWPSCPPSVPPTRRISPRTTTCSSGWTPSLPGAGCP